jgi:hypothetical protein
MREALRCCGWLVVAAVAVAAGCTNSEKYARMTPEEDRPPGYFAPSSSEATARNVLFGALYIATHLFGGGDD